MACKAELEVPEQGPSCDFHHPPFIAGLKVMLQPGLQLCFAVMFWKCSYVLEKINVPWEAILIASTYSETLSATLHIKINVLREYANCTGAV